METGSLSSGTTTPVTSATLHLPSHVEMSHNPHPRPSLVHQLPSPSPLMAHSHLVLKRSPRHLHLTTSVTPSWREEEMDSKTIGGQSVLLWSGHQGRRVTLFLSLPYALKPIEEIWAWVATSAAVARIQQRLDPQGFRCCLWTKQVSLTMSCRMRRKKERKQQQNAWSLKSRAIVKERPEWKMQPLKLTEWKILTPPPVVVLSGPPCTATILTIRGGATVERGRQTTWPEGVLKDEPWKRKNGNSWSYSPSLKTCPTVSTLYQSDPRCLSLRPQLQCYSQDTAGISWLPPQDSETINTLIIH